MKTALVVLLFFISWWGWIALGIMEVYHAMPHEWYIAIPSFILATIWGFFILGIAGKYQNKS